MGHGLILILAAILAVAVIFLVLPAFFCSVYLTAHRTPADFDQNPAGMNGTPYEPWRDVILEKVDRLRRAPCEEVRIHASDGTPLCAQWYHRGPRTVILMHGYRSTPINNFFAAAEAFLDEGWSVLMPYMRGHGKSGGRTAMGLREADDAVSWAQWADSQPGCTGIVLYGVSMGGAAVTFASDRDWPDTVRVLVVDAGYDHTERQIRGLKEFRYTPRWALIPLMRRCFRWLLGVDITATNGLDALAHATRPMVFIEGTKDTTVLPETVETSYRACSSPKLLLKAEGAPHTLSFLIGGTGLKESLFAFIHEHINLKEDPT